MTLSVETLALAILNSDRDMAGLPPQETRADVPNSDGYVVNARAVLTAIERAGYVVVPREATEAMIDARPVQGRSNRDWRADAATDWSAMLSAAPKIQHSEGE